MQSTLSHVAPHPFPAIPPSPLLYLNCYPLSPCPLLAAGLLLTVPYDMVSSTPLTAAILIVFEARPDHSLLFSKCFFCSDSPFRQGPVELPSVTRHHPLRVLHRTVCPEMGDPHAVLPPNCLSARAILPFFEPLL